MPTPISRLTSVHAGLPEWAHLHPRRALLAVTVGAVVVSVGLSCPAVAGRLRWLVDPISTWRATNGARTPSSAAPDLDPV